MASPRDATRDGRASDGSTKEDCASGAAGACARCDQIQKRLDRAEDGRRKLREAISLLRARLEELLETVDTLKKDLRASHAKQGRMAALLAAAKKEAEGERRAAQAAGKRAELAEARADAADSRADEECRRAAVEGQRAAAALKEAEAARRRAEEAEEQLAQMGQGGGEAAGEARLSSGLAPGDGGEHEGGGAASRALCGQQQEPQEGAGDSASLELSLSLSSTGEDEGGAQEAEEGERAAGNDSGSAEREACGMAASCDSSGSGSSSSSNGSSSTSIADSASSAETSDGSSEEEEVEVDVEVDEPENVEVDEGEDVEGVVQRMEALEEQVPCAPQDAAADAGAPPVPCRMPVEAAEGPGAGEPEQGSWATPENAVQAAGEEGPAGDGVEGQGGASEGRQGDAVAAEDTEVGGQEVGAEVEAQQGRACWQAAAAEADACHDGASMPGAAAGGVQGVEACAAQGGAERVGAGSAALAPGCSVREAKRDAKRAALAAVQAGEGQGAGEARPLPAALEQGSSAGPAAKRHRTNPAESASHSGCLLPTRPGGQMNHTAPPASGALLRSSCSSSSSSCPPPRAALALSPSTLATSSQGSAREGLQEAGRHAGGPTSASGEQRGAGAGPSAAQSPSAAVGATSTQATSAETPEGSGGSATAEGGLRQTQSSLGPRGTAGEVGPAGSPAGTANSPVVAAPQPDAQREERQQVAASEPLAAIGSGHRQEEGASSGGILPPLPRHAHVRHCTGKLAPLPGAHHQQPRQPSVAPKTAALHAPRGRPQPTRQRILRSLGQQQRRNRQGWRRLEEGRGAALHAGSPRGAQPTAADVKATVPVSLPTSCQARNAMHENQEPGPSLASPHQPRPVALATGDAARPVAPAPAALPQPLPPPAAPAPSRHKADGAAAAAAPPCPLVPLARPPSSRVPEPRAAGFMALLRQAAAAVHVEPSA